MQSTEIECIAYPAPCLGDGDNSVFHVDQVVVVVLVVLDTLLVITELLLDLDLEGNPSPAPFILHTLSLSILALFLLEIILKIYAYRFDFFTHKVRRGITCWTTCLFMFICLRNS